MKNQYSHIAGLCSGFGKFHSNEPKAKYPKPYLAIDWGEIQTLCDNPQAVDKDHSRWIIPSALLSRDKKAQQENGAFTLLWFDYDKNTHIIDDLERVTQGIVGGADYELYTSSGATDDHQKARGLIPLAKTLDYENWVLCQELLNDGLRAAGVIPDPASQGAAQLCYLPNRGKFYKNLNRRNGKGFDPLAAWHDELQAKRKALEEATTTMAKIREEAAQRLAELKPGIYPKGWDAFNDVYTPMDWMITAGYDQRGNTFRHPNSESGNYSASVKPDEFGKLRVNTLSTADPLYSDGKGAHDAFSTFRVLMHGGDKRAALIDAGDNLLAIGGVPFNKANQIAWAKDRDKSIPDVDLSEFKGGGLSSENKSIVITDIKGLMTHAFPPREPILAPVFCLGSINMIFSRRGVGKTHAALGIAYAAASGTGIWGWIANRSFKTFYIDGEMPGESLQGRLAAIIKSSPSEPPNGFFKIATIDMNDGRMPDLATVGGQDTIEDACQESELIIIDNLSCLCRTGKENEAESWLGIGEWAMRMRSAGKCVIFVHHAGKDGNQRGTSKREDILDTVIDLKRPSDYDPREGARFVVEFTKARHLVGNQGQSFEAKLDSIDGDQMWTTRPIEESNYEQVIELHGLGLSVSDMAQELCINKSNVSRALKKAREEGRISSQKSNGFVAKKQGKRRDLDDD
jgi:AAA domain